MKYYEDLLLLGCFSRSDVEKLTHNAKTAGSLISSYLAKGYIERVRQDLYAVISLETMLMYGKEASNRKQEIDRQHYTIPNQRPKDKHCGKI
jgi:hypothetical protein